VTNWQEPWSKAKTETVQACLAKMLETNVFAHAERQKRLLAYLVSQTMAGHGDRLKGYTIAIDVFDRNSDFDPAVEPIVRVETARLRAKLREYYGGEGRLDPVRIEIPKGAYLVRICDTADVRLGGADAAGREEKPSLAVSRLRSGRGCRRASLAASLPRPGLSCPTDQISRTYSGAPPRWLTRFRAAQSPAISRSSSQPGSSSSSILRPPKRRASTCLTRFWPARTR
jgi:hypothetical protein